MQLARPRLPSFILTKGAGYGGRGTCGGARDILSPHAYVPLVLGLVGSGVYLWPGCHLHGRWVSVVPRGLRVQEAGRGACAVDISGTPMAIAYAV